MNTYDKNDEIINLQLEEDTGWIEPTLENDWKEYNTSFGSLKYRKKNGVLYFKGLIHGGKENTAYTLPVGFRPTHDLVFSCRCSTGTYRVNVFSSGAIVINTSGDITWYSLANISFPV